MTVAGLGVVVLPYFEDCGIPLFYSHSIDFKGVHNWINTTSTPHLLLSCLNMGLAITFIVLGLVALIAAILLVSHRRRILALDIDIDSLPEIQNGLEQIAGLTGGVVMRGNAAEIFQNGSLLQKMLEDIEAAQFTVHFETYLWKNGDFECRLVDALCRKAQEGVKVRVLIDAFGAICARESQLNRLKKEGADLVYFRHLNQLNFYNLNNRMHRKILVVDGLVAYTCGHGVTDEWLGNAQDKDHWRDTGVRLRGPVVHTMQSVFTYDWCGATKQVLVGDGCFPEQPDAGDTTMHLVRSSTRSRDSSVALFYMMAIASARREVIIQNPYFIPDKHITQLLIKKAAAGITIRIMVPGEHTDSKSVRFASRRLYRKLLAAGVKIYEFQPTMMHQKIVIIDGVWSHVGTTNFDLRSLVLNAEIGVGILSEQIAEQLQCAFEDDLKRSHAILPADWVRRSIWLKTLEWLAFQVRAQI